MAKRGLVLLPPRGRLSLIHVDDLARLLLALAEPAGPGHAVEPDDGKPRGWTHKRFRPGARQGGRKKPAIVSAPGALLASPPGSTSCCAAAKAKLTLDRAAYFRHPTGWSSSGAPSRPTVAPANPDRTGPRRNRRLVPRTGLAVAPSLEPLDVIVGILELVLGRGIGLVELLVPFAPGAQFNQDIIQGG